jgi:hypothetical protein
MRRAGLSGVLCLQEQAMAEAFNTFVAPYAEGLGVSVAAGLTLMVYSYLLGDNLLYRLAEDIFVGVSVGYSAVVAFHSVLYPRLLLPLLSAPQDNLQLAAPLVMCIMLCLYVVPRARRLASVPLAFVVGVGAALAVGGALTGILVPQITATIVPLNPGLPPERLLNNLVIVAGTITSLVYFHFTAGANRPGARVIRAAASVGKWVILVAFGAIFANVVMSRISLLIGRVQFLLVDWLHLVQ